MATAIGMLKDQEIKRLESIVADLAQRMEDDGQPRRSQDGLNNDVE